ncbi:MAG TPA: hypothetical protein VF533_16845 [Solirubrobacteraceae bacterium]
MSRGLGELDEGSEHPTAALKSGGPARFLTAPAPALVAAPAGDAYPTGAIRTCPAACGAPAGIYEKPRRRSRIDLEDAEYGAGEVCSTLAHDCWKRNSYDTCVERLIRDRASALATPL